MLFSDAVFNIFTHLVFLMLQIAFHMLSIMFARNNVTVFLFHLCISLFNANYVFCINNSVLFFYTLFHMVLIYGKVQNMNPWSMDPLHGPGP